MTHLPLRVDVDMTRQEFLLSVGGSAVGGFPERICGICLDTRCLQAGDVFFALRGSRDGHAFTQAAFEKGASAVVVDAHDDPAGPFVRVDDTVPALGNLARAVRRRWGGTVVAVSGSNGKTTTKEMTGAVVGAARRVLKAPGTWNNALGVPLTLMLLRPEHEVAVLEMGMNDFGELKRLSEVAGVDVAVLTNIGPVHLEKLGSLDGVERAKGELFDALSAEGTAVVNLDDERTTRLGSRVRAKRVTVSRSSRADVTARIVEDLGPGGMRLDVLYAGEKVPLLSPFVGPHNVSNLLCALGAAYALGVPAEKLQSGVNAVVMPEMRLEVIELPGGLRVLNDCYNANPASMAVALDAASRLAGGRKIAVLGDMMELGDFGPLAHRDLGVRVAGGGFDRLYVLGQFAGDVVQGAIQGGMSRDRIVACRTHDEAADALMGWIRPTDTVLIKGSRGMTMERITERLRRWEAA